MSSTLHVCICILFFSIFSRKLKEVHSEESSAEFVANEFKKFGLERVKIEEHSIVVTYPDPARPNRLEVLDEKNSTVYNITNVENRDETKRSKQNVEELTPLMPSISSGAVEVIMHLKMSSAEVVCCK